MSDPKTKNALAQVSNASWLTRLAVLSGLVGYGLIWPVLGFIGRNAVLFTANGANPSDLFWVAVVVAIVPLAVVWFLDSVVFKIGGRVSTLCHVGLVAFCSSTIPLSLVWRHVPLLVAMGMCLAFGAAMTMAYVRSETTARFLVALSLIVPIAFGSFLFSDAGRFSRAETETAQQIDSDANSPHVVVVVLDEFGTGALIDSTDQIDPVRFPNLAVFAQGATWYRNYTTPSTFTSVNLPTILTGQAPVLEDPLFTNHPDSLFTLLSPTHELEVHESVTRLCPYTQCEAGISGVGNDGASGDPSLFDLVDLAVRTWADTLDGTQQDTSLFTRTEVLGEGETEVTDGITALLTRLQLYDGLMGSLNSPTGPTFWFGHMLLPHDPYVFYPNGSAYDLGDSEANTNDNDLGPWIASLDQQRFLLQAQYVDQLIGDLVERLRAEGIYDDSLIVLTADHGSSFALDVPRRAYADGTVGEHAYAPLFIKEPGQSEGRIDDTNLLSVDLIPTIVEILDIDVDYELEGFGVADPAVVDRGSAKEFYDFGSIFFPGLRDVFSFDGEDEFPHSDQRWIGDITAEQDAIQGLLDLLGAREMIGQEIVESESGTGLTATVEEQDRLANPSATSTALGLVYGAMGAEVQAGSEVLVAVDGVFITGSQIYEADGELKFAALLPTEYLGQPLEVELYLWDSSGSIAEIEIS